ncbi:bombesin receptor subtype-3-like [Antedon mediterranea]|uniref:bombesin receptor subtype-3-like n=1 Tax=Antedon mediterranea TaxID=105859 RepID=UPI003AF6CB36
MRSSAIILIVNACFGEIIMLIVFVPFNVSYFLTSTWMFGDFLCKALNGVVHFSSAVTIYTFVALSFDRYVAVAYPLEPGRAWTAKRTILTQLIINLVGIVVSIPKIITAQEIHRPMYMCPQCYYLQHGTKFAKVYVLLVFIVSYVTPLLLTAFNYVRIAIVLFKSVSTNKRHGVNHHTDSRIRLARTLLVMVVVYSLCLLPRYIYSISYQFMFHDVERLNKFAGKFYFFAIVCLLCSSFVNPGVLFFITGYNRSFCKAVKQESAKVLVRYHKSNQRKDCSSSASASVSIVNT